MRPPPAPGPSPTPDDSLFAKVLADPSLLLASPHLYDQLSPQEQDVILEILDSIPTPGGAAATQAQIADLGFLSFDRDVLGNRPTEAALRWGYQLPITPGQQQIIRAFEDPKQQFIAVTSGHGNGKTNIAARCILYFLLSRKDSKVITTAATWNQVETQLWQEIAVAVNRSLIPIPGTLLTTALKIADGWFAVGLSTTDYSKFSGAHAPGGVLVWIDEATGVRPEIAEAAQSLVLTPKDMLVAVGNPTNPTSWFKKACTAPGWSWIVLNCEDHPNVIHDDPDIIPGAVTRAWVEKEQRTYGKSGPMYKARVLGIWPDVQDDAVLSLAAVAEAQQRGAERYDAGWTSTDPQIQAAFREDDGRARRLVRPKVLSLDVAGPGGDLLTLGKIERRHFSIKLWRQRHDTMASLGAVIQAIEEEEPHMLVIDDTGMGSVVSSRFRELQRQEDASPALQGCRLIQINFGSSSKDSRFIRMKDWMWWNLRELLVDPKAEFSIPSDYETLAMEPALPQGHDLLEQLTTAIYLQESNGLIRVFDKKSDYSERTQLLPTRSPDLAHALILGAWGLHLLEEEVQEIPPKDPVEASTRDFHSRMKSARAQLSAAYNRLQEDDQDQDPGDQLSRARGMADLQGLDDWEEDFV